jgi:hypothetical protein
MKLHCLRDSFYFLRVYQPWGGSGSEFPCKLDQNLSLALPLDKRHRELGVLWLAQWHSTPTRRRIKRQGGESLWTRLRPACVEQKDLKLCFLALGTEEADQAEGQCVLVLSGKRLSSSCVYVFIGMVDSILHTRQQSFRPLVFAGYCEFVQRL